VPCSATTQHSDSNLSSGLAPLALYSFKLADYSFFDTYGDPLLGEAWWNGRLFLGGSETARHGGGYLEGALGAAARLRQQLLSDRLADQRPQQAANA
jgi:hypothetical protein